MNAHTGAPVVEEAIRVASVALGRALRRAGLAASVDQELVLVRALGEVDLRDRGQVRSAAAAIFLRGPHERALFESVFDRFWQGAGLGEPVGPVAEHGETDPRMPPPQQGGESLPQFRPEARSGRLLGGELRRGGGEAAVVAGQEQGSEGRRGALAAYSPDDSDADRRPLEYRRDELVAIRRLAEELRRSAPERISRRSAVSRRPGRLDLRRTFRDALRSDGEMLRPVFVSRSRRPRRVTLLCDVSGSMERYSRLLLASLQAAVRAGIRAEAFVFATALTRLTGMLSDRDVRGALERAHDRVPDWSGGTRIGPALAEFNRRWAPLGLARGAIVIVVSDGWDRGDPELLAREVRRLQLQARRLIWLNPRPLELDGQPLAIGMRAALPHIDDFIPGHDARAVAGLAGLIGGLGARRPERSRPGGRLASERWRSRDEGVRA